MDDDESEDEIAKNHKQKKVSSANLNKLQQVRTVKYSNVYTELPLTVYTFSVQHKMFGSLFIISFYLEIQELKTLLSHPLQPQSFSRHYLAGLTIS